jgi:hypothetical protein
VRARGRRATRTAHGAEAAIEVRTLASHEALGVASLLARAFRDNPLNVAVIGGTAERRLRVNLHGMRALLPTAARWARVAAADRSGRMLGALIATPPLCYPVPPAPLPSRIRCLLGQGPGVTRRWAAVFRALDALHPREPHWYLATPRERVLLRASGIPRRAGSGGPRCAHLADAATRSERIGA